VSERGFSSTIETALSSQVAHLALLVYLNWVGGAVRLWSGVGPITWNSQTWLGAGEYGTIDKIADSAEKADIGVELTLNYLDDATRNEVNANDPVGRDASIYLAVIDPANKTVTDAYELFAGFIDEVVIEDAGETGKIIVRLASELARMRRSTYYSLSHAHQQQLFTGDLGLQFAARMDEVLLWGRKATVVRGPGSPSIPPRLYPR
jgi:hypothetical protein